MYNRYKGNTGFYETVRDSEIGRRPLSEYEAEVKAEAAAIEPEPLKDDDSSDMPEVQQLLSEVLPEVIPEAASHIKTREKNKPPSLSGLFKGGLGGLLDNFNLDSLETEDIILMLVLYLMYRETKDEEYIIILAAMLLL